MIFTAPLLCTTSRLLHSIFGGIAFFCIVCAVQMSDFSVGRELLLKGVLYGIGAFMLSYGEGKYLSNV